MLAVDLARFLAFGQFGAVGRGAEKSADARAGGADALGQVALRHQFEFKLAAAVQRVKHLAVGLPGKAADDLAHAPGLEEGGQPGVAVARVVVDHRQVLGALRDQPVDQFGRIAGSAEAADQHGRAVFHIGQRIGHRQGYLVDHLFVSGGQGNGSDS